MSEHFFGHVPTGFTVLSIGQRQIVRQFPDQYWQRFFGDGRPSKVRRAIRAAIRGDGYRIERLGTSFIYGRKAQP